MGADLSQTEPESGRFWTIPPLEQSSKSLVSRFSCVAPPCILLPLLGGSRCCPDMPELLGSDMSASREDVLVLGGVRHAGAAPDAKWKWCEPAWFGHFFVVVLFGSSPKLNPGFPGLCPSLAKTLSCPVSQLRSFWLCRNFAGELSLLSDRCLCSNFRHFLLQNSQLQPWQDRMPSLLFHIRGTVSAPASGAETRKCSIKPAS